MGIGLVRLQEHPKPAGAIDHGNRYAVAVLFALVEGADGDCQSHVGADTFNGSLLVLKRGGRLVTCGSTSGPTTTINLMQLFQQQYRIFGSFGATIKNIAESLDKMAAGMKPVIDTEVPVEDVATALKRMESRQVFGKIIVTL